jgi:hypothetical protein
LPSGELTFGRLFPALVLAGAALVATSCGGANDNKRLSKSEYEAQMGAILRPLQEKTLRGVLTASPANPSEVVRRLKGADTTLHDDAEKLAEMNPPADASGPTSGIAQAVKKIADRVTAVRKDAEDGSFLRLEQFKARLLADPAVAQIRDAIVQLVNLGYNIAGSGP